MNVDLKLEEFLGLACRPIPGLRSGQHFMNTLHRFRPDIHDSLVMDGLDAYYADDRLPRAVRFVRENW